MVIKHNDMVLLLCIKKIAVDRNLAEKKGVMGPKYQDSYAL